MYGHLNNNYIYYHTYMYNQNTRSRGRISNQVIGTMASTFNKLIKAVLGGDKVECARVLKQKTARLYT